MGIVDEDIARVREATDAAVVIGEQVALRRNGNRLVGLCPFHAEKSPSFSVNAAEGLWYCFGCQARGDVITFVRETQHLDFAQAVEWLAARAGIQLRYDTPGANRDQQRKGALTDAMTRAVEWYHQRLLTGPDAKTARGYLRERGYDGDVVRAFKLGWAPEGWDELSRALAAMEIPADAVRDAGLGFVNKAGRQMDAFRSRVMFPIFDTDGKPVAFGGRILPGGDGPKYKNSQEGPLYSKRRILYGLNWAKGDVVAAGEVIVCEGYTDVIAFHRVGLARAVATCGTALADEHMARLKNFARRIILAYDADGAGQGAAERFYAWEHKLELDIHVLQLPEGTDPGEFGARDPEGLREAVANARPFLAFRLDRIRGGADLSTPEGRSRYSERALEAIAAHPSDLVRDQYVMQVSDWARVPADRLRQRLNEIRSRPPAVPAARAPGATRPTGAGSPAAAPNEDRGGWEGREGWEAAPAASDPARKTASTGRRPVVVGGRAEMEALRWAIHRPEAVALRLDAFLRPDVVAGPLEDVLFEAPLHRAAFEALLAAPTLGEAIDRADPDVADLLHRLAVEEPEEDADPDDALTIIVRLACERKLADIYADARINQSGVNLAWPKQQMEALSDPEHRVEAATQLLGWLTGAGHTEAPEEGR